MALRTSIGLPDMEAVLAEAAGGAAGLVELRYQRRDEVEFLAQDGRLAHARARRSQGISARHAGPAGWGGATTSEPSPAAVARSMETARRNAAIVAGGVRPSPALLDARRARLATGHHEDPGFDSLRKTSLEEKVAGTVEKTVLARGLSSRVGAAISRYREITEEKVIVTSDGARATLRVARPEAAVCIFAADRGRQAVFATGAGVAGGWLELHDHEGLSAGVEECVRMAVDLLGAPVPESGAATVVLAPELAGLLCHEAVGHLLESDSVHPGSLAHGRVGQIVCAPCATIGDVGLPSGGLAAGLMAFDDEGIVASDIRLIGEGRLLGFMHDSMSAAQHGVGATGNARAWAFDEQPLVRMRNTYLQPGADVLDEMIAGVGDGYYFGGSGGGTADTNGEFVFSSGHGWEIKGGRRGRLVRGATLSGNGFGVLSTVDAVGSDFRWAMGTDLCQKGQPARVDAGAPHIRCRLRVG